MDYGRCQSHQPRTICADDTGPLDKVIGSQRREETCATARRENVAGTGHIVAKRWRSIRSNKNRAGVPHPINIPFRVPHHDLYVFWSNSVGDFHRLLQRACDYDGAEAAERLEGYGLSLGTLEPHRNSGLYLPSGDHRRTDTHRRCQLVVLSLG